MASFGSSSKVVSAAHLAHQPLEAARPAAPSSVGRLYAPADGSCYVIVSSPRAAVLVVERTRCAIRVAPPSELDALIGPPGARARQCAVLAVVGVLSYPDERSLVIVTEAAERPVLGPTGITTAYVVVKVGFLSLCPDGAHVADPAASEPADATKQRLQLKALLEEGDFFFSHTLPLTLSLQRQASLGGSTSDPLAYSNADPTFTWNRVALSPLAAAGPGPWLTPLVHGALQCEQLGQVSGVAMTACLVSRRSCDHAGTRLRARGVDDAGYTANAVETEQVVRVQVANRHATAALVLLRGSAPLFWEQRGSAVKVNPKPKLMRSVALTTPAIRRHLALLHAAYHGTPVLVSLLEHKGDEAILASALSAALASLGPDSPPVKFVPLDLKAACRAGRDQGVRAAVGHLAHYAAAVGHLTVRSGPGGSFSVSGRQAGVIRVSCLDCLSRTHLMLTALALHGAAGQMYELSEALVGGAAEAVARACEPPLLAALQRMWAEAGDAISMQYAGTANIGKHSTDASKRSLVERSRGLVEKGRIAVNRYVQETFLEDSRQAAIETFVCGAPSPAAEAPSSAEEDLLLWVGTWNSNGKAVTEADLVSWFRAAGDAGTTPHIYAIGFQEFVDLSARNMLTDDGSRRRECAARVESALARMHACSYVLVGVEQCVGVLLLVYAAPAIVPVVTHVRGDVVKCGFGLGETRAGNKGGTAVRLAVAGASVCLINAHLPAGASHADERNDTFGEITSGLARAYADRYRGGPFASPLGHDLCVFFGDLNYRIEAPNEPVRAAVASGRWADLLVADQLAEQQRAGLAFSGFQEARIGFPPTYKYDAGTSTLDSSEKQRVPSYCDRVLWKADKGRVAPLAYVSCMHVVASDHKPVAALLKWSTGGGAAQAPPRGEGAPAPPPRAGAADGAAARMGSEHDTPGGGGWDAGGGGEMSLIDFGELTLSPPPPAAAGACPVPPPPPPLASYSGEQDSADLAAGLDLASLFGGGDPPPPPPQTGFPVSFSQQFTPPAPPHAPPPAAAFGLGCSAGFTAAAGGYGGACSCGADWGSRTGHGGACSCGEWGAVECGGGGAFGGHACGGSAGSPAPAGMAAGGCVPASFPVDFSSQERHAHNGGFAVRFAQDDPPPPPAPPPRPAAPHADLLADLFST